MAAIPIHPWVQTMALHKWCIRQVLFLKQVQYLCSIVHNHKCHQMALNLLLVFSTAAITKTQVHQLQACHPCTLPIKTLINHKIDQWHHSHMVCNHNTLCHLVYLKITKCKRIQAWCHQFRAQCHIILGQFILHIKKCPFKNRDRLFLDK